MLPLPLGKLLVATLCLCVCPRAVYTAVYAVDDFGSQTGALNTWNGGTGWNSSWSVQNEASGWVRENLVPLIYDNLLVSGGYAVGGDNHTAAGRPLNPASFGAAQVTGGGAIGQPGSELWISFLARREAATNWRLTAHQGGAASWTSDNAKFGVSIVSNKWVLIPQDQESQAVSTGVTASVGEAFLLVLHIEFGEPDVISLFVNPTSLGGSAPTVPSATLSFISTDIRFNRILWYPGSQTNQGSIDEIRFGSTYADVTPLDPNPNTLPEVTIVAPEDGITMVQGQVLSFTATANDVEDGNITSSLVWESHLDGTLGTGGTVQVAIANLTLGAHVFTATATDSGGRTGRARIEAVVEADTGLRILTHTIPSAVVGSSFTKVLDAFGGTPPYTWDTASGTSLPTGFSLGSSTGSITGQGQALVSRDIDFRVTDSLGVQSTRLLTFRVVAPPSTGPQVYTTMLPPLTLGVPYDFTISADSNAVTYVVRGGSLPPGLTLNQSTGRIQGTVPTSVTSDITSFEIWVGNSQFNPALSPDDHVNNTYRTARLYGMRMYQSSDAPRFVRVFLASGQSNMGGTGADGAAVGTVYAPPLSDVWYAPTHPSTPNIHVNNWIPMGINPTTPGVGSELSFARNMADAFPSDRIAIIKSAVGGAGIGYWLPGEKGHEALQEAIIFARQRLDAQVTSGEISGYSFEGLIWMQGENECNALPEFGANSYDTSLTNLATWIKNDTFNPDFRVVLGRVDIKLDPSLGGPDSINVQALTTVRSKQQSWADARSWADWFSTDDLGHTDAWHYNGPAYLTMGERFADSMIDLLGAGPQIDITTHPQSQTVTEGANVSLTVVATGDQLTYQWQVTSLGGSSWSNISWAVSSTLSLTNVDSGDTGDYRVVITDSASDSVTSNTASLQVGTAGTVPTITTTTLPSAIIGTAYTNTLQATGGDGALAWTVVSGSLPSGLGLGSSGLLSGTPSGSAGTSNFTVRVTDVDSDYDEQALSLTVQAQAAAPTFSPSAGTYEAPLNITLSSATTGASFVYTTDGSDPKSSGTATTGGSLTLNASATVRAYAQASGFADSSVSQAVYVIEEEEPVDGNTLAVETFDYTASTLIEGLSGGSGWGSTWEVEGGSTSTGYVIASGSLASGDLVTTGNRLSGGHNWRSVGRLLDLTTTFAPYLNSSNRVGEDDTDLWFAWIQQVSNTAYTGKFALDHSASVYHDNNGVVRVQNVGGNWQLSLRNGAQTDDTGVAVTTGSTLFVLRLRYGTTDTADLYINPPLVAQGALGSPDATLTTTSGDLAFTEIVWFPNHSSGHGALDEIRIGTTFESVTPRPSSSTEVWTSQDIGSPSQAGSMSYNSGSETFTLEGSGDDIWNNNDSFHYATLDGGLTGNGTITARVVSLDNTDSWAKVGVMMRATLNGTSTHAMTAITAGNGAAFQRRVIAASGSDHTGVGSITAPYWVRLTRSGTSCTGYISSNGTSWTQIGSPVTISAFTGTVQIGLCVTSHNNSALCTAVFDNVTIDAD